MTIPSPLSAARSTYFFTLRLRDAQSEVLVSHIDLLRDATRLCRKRWPFAIDAAVILPNTLHMIWTLPEGDADFSKRLRMIKTGFSRHAPAPLHVPESLSRRGDKGIWQRRFWKHQIRDEEDLVLHMHLIRSAPIHAGLVKRPSDWPYCSLHQQRARALKTTVQAPSVPNPTVAAIAS